MKIVVAGQGYVGLPLAVRAAEVGHRVVGYDVDPHRVQQLTAGQSYVRDVASARLCAVLDSGAYSATADGAYAVSEVMIRPPDTGVFACPEPGKRDQQNHLAQAA
ncbi:hypothetical protein ACIOTI_32250 [Streptomyces sp. NPDC087843]|uniref:hypothetical protein n=1 Tax=Streptomyces sp. NPDC087843 TaxID=3365804 RepID=UPI00380831C0